jgi:predicted HTH domain antitoxin
MSETPNMVVFETTIPEDVYTVLRGQGMNRELLGETTRQLLAMHLFQNHTLSLGKAARLAGLDKWRFIDLLGQHQIPVIDMDEEEFAKEVASVEEMLQQLPELRVR